MTFSSFLSPSLANCLIEGNTVDFGFATTDDATTTNYYYNTVIYSTADCRISQNALSGPAPAFVGPPTAVLIDLYNCSCEITGNTLIRTTSIPILAYIRNNGTSGVDGNGYDHIITDNIFDQNTIDGSSFVLATGLTQSTVYQRNKNQIGYAVVPWTTQMLSFNSYSAPSAWIVASSDFPPTDSTDYGALTGTYATAVGFGGSDRFVLRLYDDTASPGQRTFGHNVDVSKSIPFGTRVLDAQISIYNPSTVPLSTAGGTNAFQFSLEASRNHTTSIDGKTYNSKSVPTWMVGFAVANSLAINGGNEPNMRSAYQVIDLPITNFTTGSLPNSYTATAVSSTGTSLSQVGVDDSPNFVSTSDTTLTASLYFQFVATSQGVVGTPLIVVSPLIITYIW
jgi:hypothetical protein